MKESLIHDECFGDVTPTIGGFFFCNECENIIFIEETSLVNKEEVQ